MTDDPEDTMSFDDMMDTMGAEPEDEAMAEVLGAAEAVMAEPAPEAAPEAPSEEPAKKTRGPKKAERASGLIITDELPERTRLEMEAGRAALAAKTGS